MTVQTLIQQRILALSYACASRYRVGDLLNHSSQGPQAINLHINGFSQLLLTVCCCSPTWASCWPSLPGCSWERRAWRW